jgi:Ca-activated chloride channel family protein
MSFQEQSIWFLLALGVLPLLGWWMIRRRRASVRFSSTEPAHQLKPTLKQRLRWLLPAMQLLAIALVIVGMARPRKGREQTQIFSEGIAIEMLVDRSGSMQAMDFKLDGKPVDRLSAVKDVATTFIRGDEQQLAGREADMIGLVSFARFADNVSPMTLDHAYLIDRLEQTDIVTTRDEDGTAIGDAIGLGVERLRSLQETRDKNGQDPIASRVIILLTDGENNVGDLDPLQAAEIAKQLGVRIYTIGVGTTGRAPVPAVDPFTGRKTLQWVNVSIDEETLQKIADATGGQYFRATDTDSLRDIYARIDELEKTKIEERRFAEYRELAIKTIPAGRWTLPPLLLMALGLMGAQVILANTLWRSIP